MLTEKKLREQLQLALNNLSVEELRAVDIFIASLKQKSHEILRESVETYSVLSEKETEQDNELYSQKEFETLLWNELNRAYGVDLRGL